MTQAPPSLESLMAQVADEFLDRQARGEAPGVEEYAERYPQIAGFIRQMFPTLAVLRAGGDDPAGDDGPRRLGDFRVLREVGRGGMGVVYEAEQISLGRRVALKVLPFASALDRRQLQRFKTEAQAAGQLHHTNIVPVYFVGEDRGVHFFAMQFIDGRTIADLIADLRQEAAPPAAGESTPPRNALSTMRSGRKPEYFRWVAESGVQAAEALEHAHSQGVVHRDVKPANLIRDHAGQIWVTDFGLAQVRTDVRLTATGDVVGTLRYMSPEQALRPAQVDHRSDVYSLGVTLYEMLTLRPAFPAEAREELLRQIADREPPSAQVADRTVPPELDVIVRKAMAKEPDERYATAKDLAADLRRFLDNLPILAKRPTLWQYTKKWTRRHRHIVTTAVIAMFVLLVAMTAATGVLLAKNAEVRAERQNVKDKNDLLEQANEKLKQEIVVRKAAEDEAQTNFAEYHAAMDKMLETVRPRLYVTDEDAREARIVSREVLRLLSHLPDDVARKPEIRGLKSTALGHTAVADFMLGDGKAAEPGFQEAETLSAALAEAHPKDPAVRHQYGILLYHRAIAAILDRQTDTADGYWERSMTEFRAGLAVAPGHEECRFALSEVINKFDMARKNGAPVRPKETVADALQLVEGLAAEFPRKAEYRFHRALLRCEIQERKSARDPAGTAAGLTAVLPELQAIAAEDPTNPVYHRELARWTRTLATLLFKLDRKAEAEKQFRDALAAAQVVVANRRNSANDHFILGQTAQSLAVVLGPLGPNKAQAAEVFAVGVRALESAVALEQGTVGYETYRKQLFDLSLMQGRTLIQLNRPTEAAEAINRAAGLEDKKDAKGTFVVAQQYGILALRLKGNTTIPVTQRTAAVATYEYLALEALKRAGERGFTDWATVRKLAVFEGLKDTEEFKTLTAGK